jgi:hypothetical protein
MQFVDIWQHYALCTYLTYHTANHSNLQYSMLYSITYHILIINKYKYYNNIIL